MLSNFFIKFSTNFLKFIFTDLKHYLKIWLIDIECIARVYRVIRKKYLHH